MSTDGPWGVWSNRRNWLPNWRQGFLMLATFVVVLTGMLGWQFAAKARSEEQLVASWLGLLDRCRVAIETRQPLDTRTLATPVIEPDPLWSHADRSKVWSPIFGARFIIREVENDTSAGNSVRGCDVIVADWRKPLNRAEIAFLSFAFLQERSRLTATQEYEPRDPLPSIRGLTSLGFGPVKPNPVGCSTIFVLSLVEETNELTASFGDPL